MSMIGLFAPLRQAALIALIGTALAVPAHAARGDYTIIDLGTLGSGNVSIATDINNLGQVVGMSMVQPVTGGFTAQYLAAQGFINGSETADAGGRAFSYTPQGGLVDLALAEPLMSRAHAVNDNGVVVGSLGGFGTGSEQGFRYSAASGLQITGSADAVAVNDQGDIAVSSRFQLIYRDPDTGEAKVLAPPTQVLNADGSVRSVTPDGGLYSTVSQLNNAGQVAGTVTLENPASAPGLSGLPQAFIQDADGSVRVIDSPYGSYATGMNELGQMIGYRYTSAQDPSWPGAPPEQAFIYDKAAGLQLFAHDGARLADINDLGWIVGRVSSLWSDPSEGAFLYRPDKSLVYLAHLLPADSAWSQLIPTALNNQGQIVGMGLVNGNLHAFLMSPTAVPEPGTWWLMALGLSALAAAARHRRRVH